MTRVAVLGCGSIGKRHLRNLVSLGTFDICAFDPDIATCKAIQSEFDLTTVDQIDKVWKWAPDVALITSPSNHHLSLAAPVIQRGIHVFIEKPVSHTLDGLDHLCEEAEHRRLITMVGCNMRFHPGPAQVKLLIADGRIGQVISARIFTGSYLPAWRPGQDYHVSYSASPQWGGAILDCIHEIDLAVWYFGPAQLLSSVSILARSIGLTTDGLTEMLLQHGSGVLTSVHLNFIQRDYRRGCQIIGTEGTIYWDFMQHKVEIYGAAGQIVEQILEPKEWQVNQMYVDEMTHFLSAVKNGRMAMNPLREAAQTLNLALAARASGCQAQV